MINSNESYTTGTKSSGLSIIEMSIYDLLRENDYNS